MLLNSLIQDIRLNLKNIPGWRTRRKIVVIECDDWGGIRMPSKIVFDTLEAKGIVKGDKRYNRYDTLETHDDLEMLFNVLNDVSDCYGHPAVMTAVTNVANPDFEKIKKSGYVEYHYEKFTDTLKKYYPDCEVFSAWKEGIRSGIFIPELHGREHIAVPLWLKTLRDGDETVRTAFDHGFVFVEKQDLPAPARDFRPEFFFTSENDIPFLRESIIDSVRIYKEIFGFTPKVFVPGNGIFHPYFDNVVAETGIYFLYVSHSMPYPDEKGGLKYRRFITGQKGPSNLTYYTRNCAFEPTDKSYKGIALTMDQISAAFRWGKPAIISTHRVNFTGGIDPANRTKGLDELQKLLKAITKKWPNAEFMSSSSALELMKGTD